MSTCLVFVFGGLLEYALVNVLIRDVGEVKGKKKNHPKHEQVSEVYQTFNIYFMSFLILSSHGPPHPRGSYGTDIYFLH